MRNKKIIGVDLEIGSSPNSSFTALYAIYLYDGSKNIGINLRKVSMEDLNKLIYEFQPDFIASDNILEITGRKEKINLFLGSLPISTNFVQITYDENGYQQTLSELAKENGLNIYGKLNSEKTAELCVYLLIKGIGKIINGNGGSILVKQYIHAAQVQESKSLVKKQDMNVLMNDIELRQFPNLVSKFSPNSTFVSLIGEGKEAIVGLFTNTNSAYHVIKCFRKFSPVVNALKSKLYHYHDWDYAIKLAKSEEEHLKIANNYNIAVPKVISQSGPFVVMEAITFEDDSGTKIAPPLSQVNIRKLDLDPVEIFYHSLDLLIDMFAKAKLVHNDFSAQNLLLKNDHIIAIDFSQAEKVNFKTFIHTPKRIRIDDAFYKVKNDINTITTYFSKKYRLSIETPQIYNEFVDAIPKKLLDQCDEDLII